MCIRDSVLSVNSNPSPDRHSEISSGPSDRVDELQLFQRALGLTPPGAAWHLRRLESARLVRREPAGRSVVWTAAAAAPADGFDPPRAAARREGS